MLPLAQKILIVYSLILIVYLITKDIKKVEKGCGKGLEAVILIPVFILLINLI